MMSRFLFLLFLVSFLLIADSAPYYLTGELQSWTNSDTDFTLNAATNDIGAIFSPQLDLFGKPTLVGTPASIQSAASFYRWWNTPITKQTSLTPFSLVMHDTGVGGKFLFNRQSGFFPVSGVSLFSFHVRGELNCAATSCTPSALQVLTSDDFAMYVDGSLVCYSSGARGAANTVNCNIPSLSSTGGSFYTHYVDIFYARRWSSSPAILSFELPDDASTCSLFSRSIYTRNIYPFGPSNLQPFGNAVVYGSVTDPQPVLQLVKSGDTSSFTAVYSKTPIRYQNGFSTYFRFNLTGSSSEGFAFVVQSLSNQGPAAGTGYGLGYSIAKSLAIEFDTTQNTASLSAACEPAVPHVEVHVAFGGDNSPCRPTNVAGTFVANANNAAPNFRSGQVYEAYIEYLPGADPSAGMGTVSVWAALDNTLGSNGTYHASRFTNNNYLARASISNSALRTMFGTTYVYPGFTSGATTSGTNLYIWDWKVNTVSIGAFNTQVVPSASNTQQVARNTQGSKSFTITLKDACGTSSLSTVPIGTDVVNATLVSGATVGSTFVDDLDSGSYDIWWWHTLATTYNLTVSVYGESIVPGTASTYFPAPFNVSIIPDIINAPNCYFLPATIASPNYLASDTRNVTIVARDQFNNNVSKPDNGFTVFFQTFPASPYIYETSQNGPEHMFQVGTHVAQDRVQIFLRYTGSDIAGSPTQYLNVTAGLPPDATQTAITLIGQGLQGSYAGVPATIAFQVQDSWQNTHATVSPFNVTAKMACVTGYTDSRCANTSLVTINVIPGMGSDPSYFQVVWTTPVVGPCYTVNITLTPSVNGPQLPGLPNVCVLPNNVSVATSTINAGGTYTAGSFGSFTIQAKDAFNNSRTSDNSPLGPFTVKIGTVTTTCGGPAAPPGAEVDNLQCQYSGVGGQYAVSFTPKIAGPARSVTVTLSSQPGQQLTSTIAVVPGPGYAPNDIISNVPTEIVAGETKTISFTSEDFYHNLRLNGSDTASFVVSMLPQGQTSGTAVVGPVQPKADGQYTVDLSPFTAGKHDIEVKLLGQNVSNTPQTTTVVPNLTNLMMSPAAGPGLFGGVALQQTNFTITPMDNFTNLQNKWTDAVTCDVCAPDTTTCGVQPCTPTKVGTDWRISFTAPTYVVANNKFIVRVYLVSNSSANNQSRLFNMFSTQSGDVQNAILRVQPTAGCNLPGTSPYNTLNNSLVAGSLTYYYLFDYAQPDCTGAVNNGINEPQFNVEFNSLVGSTKFSGTVLLDTSKTTVGTGGQAVFNVSVVGTKVGWYKITVLGGGVETTQSKGGIYAQVIPGPLDPPSCTVTPPSATVVAGTKINWTINLRDAYLNDLLNATLPVGQSLEVVVKDQQGRNMTSGNGLLTPGVNIAYNSTAPIVKIDFNPTTAGVGSMAVYGPNPAGGKGLIASKTFPITVLADKVALGFTCFFAPWNGTACPSQIPTATAGQPFPVALYARDQYNNQVNDANLTFTLAIAPQTTATVSSVFSGAAGLYALTLQANKTVSLPPGDLSATAAYSSTAGNVVGLGKINVQPAALSEVYSWVTGLDAPAGQFIAGGWVNWTLHARDLYNNVWYETIAAAFQIDLTLSGPESASKAVLAIPSKGYIASSTTNPGALYNYQYIPTTASTNNLPTVDAYTVSFIYNGVALQNLTGNDPFLVYPSVPEATQTIIPQITPLVPAGQMTNLTIQLRDQYGNNIINGSQGVVDIQFFNGPGTQCSGNVIDQTKLVSNFTNREPSYIHLDDNQKVVDLGNGKYNLTIWTVVAGPYFGGITVNGNAPTICRLISTVFTVVPLEVDGPKSLISGQAIDHPDNNVAGTDLSLYLVLRDKYENIVNKRDQTILVGDTVPHVGPDVCPTNDSIVWLTDSGAPFPALPAYFKFDDNKNGSWNVNFQAYKSGLYHLVLLVNTSTMGAAGPQVIGLNCHNLTVIPWYVYTWDATPPSSVEEALTTSLVVIGVDKYGNNVTKGEHYWKLVYRRSTVDELAPYGFARNTPKAEPYEVFYNAEHFGDYTAYVTLVQDPLYADQNKYPVLTAQNETSIPIAPATCNRKTTGAQNFRCPDTSLATLGTCVASWNLCPGSGSGVLPTCSGVSCSLGPSPTGNGYCGPSGGVCPQPSGTNFPPWASASCGIFGNRMTNSDCPSSHICPTGWTKCPDGRSCFLDDDTICPQVRSACSGKTCANGACVQGDYDCPTEVTCSTTGTSVCPDGTCVTNADMCPSLFLCAPPNPMRCSDGSCRRNLADCPTSSTCPLGYAKCETGHCVKSVSGSGCPDTACDADQVHCADGTCRDNYALCPSGITCPSARPVLCPDFSCVASVSLCRMPMVCSNSTLPYLCPSGTCAYSQVECPTAPTCPLDTPTLCEDLTCAKTLADCNTFNALSARCPPHRPYNCPDGSCANSRKTCPTLGDCKPDTPVRCTTAACAVAGNVCPLDSQLSCPGILCPGGGCAQALSQCPTAMTCPNSYERCADGSCRTNCTDIKRDPATFCVFPYYECPGHEAGFSCVLNPAECPQSPSCPFDRPIRCVDRSCAHSAALCPYPPVYASGYSTCAANSFTKTSGGCSNIASGPGSSTCPWGWVKCWDETCRQITEDCPPEPLCVIDHPNPRFVKPYLCPAGDCARNLYQCQKLDQCAAGLIRCPAYYATGPESGIKCVSTLSDCPSLTSPTSAMTCPLGFVMCRSGKCRTACDSPAAEVLCPEFMPYQCSDGKCTQRPNQCAPRANCTGVSAGHQRCWDKTCTTGTEKCTDNPVTDAAASLNVCPLSAPYRCPSGFCAISSGLCPDLPRSTGCTAGKPFPCADGTCEMTSIQCRVIKPCFDGYVRCDNAACMLNGTCPTDSASKVCKSGDIMCPNGLCASSNATCWNEKTGCRGNMTKCDDGLCAASCGTIPQWDGCGTGLSRCYDGSCLATCPKPVGCNPADPAGTPCEWSTCGTTRCTNGYCGSFSDALCKTAWGCDYTKPFRGVDGQCYHYPADGSSTSPVNGKTRVPSMGTVVCPSLRPHVCKDGSCVANVTHCPAIQPCSSGQLCDDMTCGASCTTHVCPIGSPTLCPDGSCRKTARECGPLVMAPQCPSPMVQCFDGYCTNSSLECVRRQYQIGGKTNYQQNANHGTGACASGEFLCWNGACVLQSTAPPTPARSGAPLACPPVPACPAENPLLCWDGTCIKNGTTCSTDPGCSGGAIRCEDGTCRNKGACPQFAGCSQSAPFYCAGSKVQCVKTSADCKIDPEAPEVCASNCVSHGLARAQQFVVYPGAATTVDVVLDDDLAPITQIKFPPGAFGTAIGVWTVNPATFDEVKNGKARIKSILTPRTPAQILLSPPFYLQWNGVSGDSRKGFNLNVTVTSNIDTKLFAGATTDGQILVTNPCQIFGGWIASGQFAGPLGLINCLYTLNVTNMTTSLYQIPGNDAACPTWGLTAQVQKVNTSTDPIADTQLICVCSNVTFSNGTGAQAFTKGDVVCVLWDLRGADQTNAILSLDKAGATSCPVTVGPTTAYFPSMTDGSGKETECTGSGSGLIDPLDICLGIFNPSQGREWVCTFPGYADRTNNPPWFPESGKPNYNVRGLLPWTQIGLPMAMLYLPRPSPPLPISSEESWWQKYGKIVLGVGISMFILLLILICAISRLIRYRRKYHEERAEAEELREQAQELDEKHGGLGVYDDEVEMIANPLVVEMQELQKQLEQTNAHLKTQEELDEHQMAALDKERQRILEEIKRVKDAIAAQAKTNPTRVDEVPPSGAVATGTGSGTASSGTGAERQEFNTAPTARRKKQDL